MMIITYKVLYIVFQKFKAIFSDVNNNLWKSIFMDNNKYIS